MKNNIVIFNCMYSTFNTVTYCVLKTGKLIFYIYSQYEFNFEQCNYTMSPTTPVFVDCTMNNYNFFLRRNPFAQTSNTNSKTRTSWDINNITTNWNFIKCWVLIYELNFELAETTLKVYCM